MPTLVDARHLRLHQFGAGCENSNTRRLGHLRSAEAIQAEALGNLEKTASSWTHANWVRTMAARMAVQPAYFLTADWSCPCGQNRQRTSTRNLIPVLSCPATVKSTKVGVHTRSKPDDTT